jgi:hypothetical protein
MIPKGHFTSSQEESKTNCNEVTPVTFQMLMQCCIYVLEGQPEGRKPLQIPRRRWEDTIKMYLQEVGWGTMEWISLAQDSDRW